MDTARLSVTEVRNALRCPRVFVLGRLRQAAVAFPVGSSCLGGAFHRIVDRFAQTVSTPPEPFASLAAGASADVVRDALTRWVLGFLVDELEADPSYRAIPSEVDDLAEALRQFAAYLASRLGGGKPSDAIGQLVRAGEQSVEAEVPEAGVVVNGRIDALYRAGDGGLDVVEYKLTDEANETLDRAQVALYRELLRRAERVEAKPVVLRFNPALSVHEIPAARADALIREDLIPLLRNMNAWLAAPEAVPPTRRSDLCAACPVAVDCAERYPSRLPARDDPPMAASRPRPAPKGGLTPAKTVQPATGVGGDEDGEKEALAIQRRIVEELRKDGITTTSDKPVVGPTVYVIHVARPRGSVAQLDSAARNVVHRLASADGIEASYAKTGARREFTVRRPRPRTVLLAPLLEARKEWLSERPGRLVIGEQPDGTVLTGDLADSATPHLLVAGQAGSGKSWLLRTLVASLVHWHGPSAIRITLLDPKRVTFNAGSFSTAIAAHLDGPILYGIDDAMPCIERYVEVMEERYLAFEREQVSDLHEYNQQVGRERWLPRHVIVIDEFQDLTADRKSAAEFSAAVARLGAKARAAGVHMILATQRPDRQTVPPLLKANLGGKIALRVASAINSRVILDDSGAENLLGKGDLYADLGQGLVRAQAAVLGT